MCANISRWNRRTALSVHCSLYWLVRRWCLIKNRMVWRSSRLNANRAWILSNIRAPTSAWPWKWTPSSVNVRVGTLPMSCSSAAQRTSGRPTVCRTTCLVWAQTSLCIRPLSWTRSTVASSSGNKRPRIRVSCSHSSAASTSRPISMCSTAARSRCLSASASRAACSAASSVTASGGGRPPASAIAPAISSATIGSASTRGRNRSATFVSAVAVMGGRAIYHELVQVVLVARVACKVESLNGNCRWRSEASRGSAGSTLSSTTNLRLFYSLSGRSRQIVSRPPIPGSVLVAKAYS